MPKRLEKRVLDLHQKFAYDPFARAQNVEANRQSHLAMIRAKAASNSRRAEAAAARRAQGTTYQSPALPTKAHCWQATLPAAASC